MSLKDPVAMKAFQKGLRNQRERSTLPSELEGLRNRPGYVTAEDHQREINQMRKEMRDLTQRMERIGNLKFNLPQTVQRSVSIPVTVDQGGTGRTDNLVVNIGPATTNGSWRFSLSGNDLIAERLEAGLWVNKGGFTA